MKIVPKPLPPLDLLKELFEISKDSPSGLVWKNPRSSKLKAGQVAGTKNPRGYWRIRIKTATDKGKQYYAHRIIYYMQTGKDPAKSFIDHVSDINDNLDVRIATQSQNCGNRKKCVGIKGKKCTSIYKGVHWKKCHKKWCAQLQTARGVKYLGCFENEKDAAKAYNKAAIEYFGEFAKLNKIE